jgi:hypothetical protein
MNYAVVCGCHFYVIDTTTKTAEEVKLTALPILSKIGMSVKTEYDEASPQ